jgi:hypothetical protein
MNVEIGAEAALFPEKEYISDIFVAVWSSFLTVQGKGEGGRGAKSYDGEKAWSSKNLKIIQYSMEGIAKVVTSPPPPPRPTRGNVFPIPTYTPNCLRPISRILIPQPTAHDQGKSVNTELGLSLTNIGVRSCACRYKISPAIPPPMFTVTSPMNTLP